MKTKPVVINHVSVQPSGVGDLAGDDVLGDGGQAEHVVLAGKLQGRAVNGMRDE